MKKQGMINKGIVNFQKIAQIYESIEPDQRVEDDIQYDIQWSISHINTPRSERQQCCIHEEEHCENGRVCSNCSQPVGNVCAVVINNSLVF